MTIFNSYVKLPEGISQCMEKTQAAGLPQMPQMPRPPGLHLPVATHSSVIMSGFMATLATSQYIPMISCFEGQILTCASDPVSH